MKPRPADWLTILLCLGLALPAVANAASLLETPVVQDSIPTPGEAVARMAARKKAAQDAVETTNKEAERQNRQAQLKLFEARAERRRQQAAATLAAQARIVRPKPVRVAMVRPKQQTAAIATQPAASITTEQHLASLAQQRQLGSISGDDYLAARHKIIYGETAYRPRPPAAPAAPPATHSVEQQLAALKQRRARGDIGGDEYLAERKRLIHGG